MPSPTFKRHHARRAAIRVSPSRNNAFVRLGCGLISLGALMLGGERTALAVDAEVTAQTAAQAYSLRSPFGEPILLRRRITQTLGLGVYNLLSDEKPGGPQIFVKLRMRLDGELGVDSTETAYTRGDPNSRYVPGLQEAPVDLMYGYVEGRNLLRGHLGFKIGRQYLVDALGWWSFDGALLRVNVPYVHFEAYGGFEQRGGLPLSLGRYERGGVWRGDRAALDGSPDVYPMFEKASLAPAFGFAVESEATYWIHGRLDYRKVYNTGAVVTRQLPDASGSLPTYDSTRTSSERLGYQLDGTLATVGAVRGGFVYDFFNGFVSSYNASLDGYVMRHLTVSAEWDYYKPTFDGDSIWNWFTHSPISTATGRIAWDITTSIDVAGNGGIRIWETDEDPSAPTLVTSQQPQLSASLPGDLNAENTTTLLDGLGSLFARYRSTGGVAAVRGVAEAGQRGHRYGVDLSGQKELRGGRYFALARGSIYDWDDKIRPDRSATSVGYVLGAGWRPGTYANMQVEWEHNANRLVGQRFRVLALLNLLVGK